MSSWMDSVRSWLKPANPGERTPRRPTALGLEALEVRDVPSIVAGGTAPQVGPTPTWTSAGPAGIDNFSQIAMPSDQTVNGAVERFAFNPFNPNQAVAGTVNGGVWITNDIQSPKPTWTPVTDFQGSLSTASIAYSPVIPNQIWVGTGSYSSGGIGANYGAGVIGKGEGGAAGHLYRSNDGGATWTEVGGSTFGQRRIRAIVPTALNGGATVFAAITDNTTPTNMGVYRSDNSGATWVRVSGATGTGLPNLPVTDLIPDARNDPATGFQRYYAAVIPSGATTGAGVYMLDTAGGNTVWKNISNNIDPSIIAGASRFVLASSAAGAGPLWVGFIDGNPASPTFGGFSAVYRGIPYPAGNTFIWSAVGPAGLPPAVHSGAQGDVHAYIAADPQFDNMVYVAGDTYGTSPFYGTVVRGDSTANTWTNITGHNGVPNSPAPAGSINPQTSNPAPTTAPHADTRYLKFAPDGTLMLAGDGGIFRASNPQGLNGQAPVWSSAGNNIQAFELYSTAVDDKNNTDPTDDVYLVAAQDNGTAEGTAGTTFQGVGGGDGTIVLADPVGGYRYYSAQNFSMRRRDPSGTLAPLQARVLGAPGFSLNPSSGLTPIENLPYQTAAVLNQAFPNEMLVGGNGTLYISFDHGDTFRSIGGLTGTNPNRIFPGTVVALAFGTAQSPNSAYVATDDGNVYFIPDVNNSASGLFFFTNFSTVASGRQAVQIVLDPNNPLIAYAVTDRGVFKTTNGTTWANVTGNLLGLTSPGGLTTLASIALFTNGTVTSSDDAIMVGGYGGVYTLGVTNAGNVWSKFSTGIPDVIVTSVIYDARSDTLVAGTYGRGVWKVDNVGTILSPGLLVTVTGDFNDNVMAVWPDMTDPRFFFVTDGLGGPAQRFDSTVYRAVSFKGLSGRDTILVGTPDGTSVSHADLLTINVIADGGGNPGDSLVVDDRADLNGGQVTVTPTVFGHGVGDNLFGKGGGGSYTGFNAGNVLFEFGPGTDTLFYDDTGSTAAATYTLAGGRVAKSSAAPIDYTGLEQLVVQGSSGANTYQVNSTTATSSTSVLDGIGSSTFNIQGDGLTGANTFRGNLGNDVFNLNAGAGLTGPVQVSGGGGADTLNLTGRASADSVTFALSDAVGGAAFTGFGQYAGVDSLEAVVFDGRGTNSFTYVDRSGIGFGTPTDPDGGIMYTPLGPASGRVIAGRGLTGVPTVTFTGVTGDFAAGGATDVLTVYGVSDTGLAVSGELTSADGRDTVTVSDQKVTISNAALGQLRSVTLLGGADTVNTLFVKTGNEKGPEGDTVTAYASATLNIVIDGGQPNGTTPGDRVQVIGSGSQTRVQTNDPTLGPPQIRVTFTDGTSVGLINFENSSSGVAGAGALAVGSGPGVPAMVQVVDPVTGQAKFTVFPFGGFGGGVSVATGDLTGDGVPDLVVGAGPGGGPLITVYDGATQAVLGTFYAFEATFAGGVNVSLGDFNRDGIQDIVIGTGVGGGPRVKVLDGKNLQVIRDVFVYEPSFRGGVSVAVGDVNQDGTPDLITSAGSGGGPRVVIFDGANLRQLYSFYVFDPASRNGFNVASGDVTGDGVADVIVGAGTGDPSLVRVFSGATLQPVIDFNVDVPAGPFGDIPLGPGVRLGAADVDGDGVAEVVVGMGPGSTPTLRYYQVGRINPQSNAIEIGLKLLREDAVFDPFYSAGIYVGQSPS